MRNYAAFVFFGIIFANKDAGMINNYTFNHEKIHVKQGNEMLWLFFYTVYFVDYLCKLAYYRNHMDAYRNISFEREAYANMYNLKYNSTRKFWAWTKYLYLKNGKERS